MATRVMAEAGTSDFNRASSRYSRLFVSGGMALFAKSINALITLISVPLTVHYLGAERFGMWMTIAALATFITFADFGLGNGLVSAIAHRDGQDDHHAIARLVSTAFFPLVIGGIAILALFGAFYRFIPFASLFSVHSPIAVAEAGPATAVFVACFCANLPLAVSQRVQMGLQEFWLVTLWTVAGNLLGLLGLLVAVHTQSGLPALTLAVYGGPVVAMFLSALVEFGRRRQFLRPRWKAFSSEMFPNLMRTGMSFFALQVLTILCLGMDNLIISAMEDAKAVAPYAIMARYTQLALVANVFLQPLWPAFGEALGRKDYAWARRALTHASIATLALSIVIAAVTAIFGEWIVRLWVGTSIHFPPGLTFGIAATIPVLCFGGVIAAFMNGEKLISKQLQLYFWATVAGLSLKILFMRTWGVAGVPWGTVLGFGTVYCLFGIRLAYRSIGELASQDENFLLATGEVR